MRDLLQQIRSAKSDDAKTPVAAAEAELWQAIQHHSMGQAHFQRRIPVGPFVVPFLSHGHRVIIQIDPVEALSEQQLRRAAFRLNYLEAQGFRILRFACDDVLTDVDGVVDMILSALHHPIAA